MTAGRFRRGFGLGAQSAGSLLIGLFLSALGLSLSSQAAQSEPDLITLRVPDVQTLPPAAVSNVWCHIRPVRRSPGDPGYGQPPSRPDCDQRPSQGVAPPASTDVTYHGGSVITSGQQTFIFLNCAASCWGNPVKFVGDFLSSEFVHVLDQYMVPTVLKTSGRYTSNPTAISLSGSQPHTLTDSNLQTLILNAIKAQFPSGGGGGYGRMYSMFLPSGQDLCMSGNACYCPDNNCGTGTFQFCAYHSSFDSTDAVGQPIHVIYLAMPYQDVGGGCTTPNGPNGTQANSTNDGFSHELSEAITDPDGNAWYRNSDGSEIADICFPPEQNPIYLNGSAYEIQSEYSNAAHGCVGPFPNLVSSHVFNGLNVQSASVWSVSFESDIAWRDTSGNTAIWFMNGATVLSSGGLGVVPTVWSILGQRDFNGDGNADLLWRDTSGNTAIWFMNGLQVSSSAGLGNIPTIWTIVAAADFNGDGKGDILWQDTSGNLAMWLMNGATVSSSAGLGNVPLTWSIVGTGDYNGDGKADLLWRDTSGNTAIWFMNGAQVSSSAGLGNISTVWSVVGTGDFNGDGMSDILWHDTSGNTAIWFMNGASVASAAGLGNMPTAWSVVQTGDYNADGKSDIFWRDTSGNTALWFMNGATVSSTGGLGNISTAWTVQSVNAE